MAHRFKTFAQRRAAFARLKARLPSKERLKVDVPYLYFSAKGDIKRVGEKGASGLRRFYEATKTTYKPKKKRRGKV